jgi:antitoxin component of RelBE/YafQ-DinJ toxin-antitoxin module
MEYTRDMASLKIQLRIKPELKEELWMYANKYGMTFNAVCEMFLRLGIDVVKVSTSPDYMRIMEQLAKEYEKQEH